jgi:hypothetical protein
MPSGADRDALRMGTMSAIWTFARHGVAFVYWRDTAIMGGPLAGLQGRGAADREQQGHSAYGCCGEE